MDQRGIGDFVQYEAARDAGKINSSVTRTRRPVGIACRLLVLAALIGACDVANIPDQELPPIVVGVVQMIEPLGGGEFTYHLDSGDAMRLNPDEVEAVTRSIPIEGGLFLYGEADWGAWYVGLPPSGDDCYALSGPGELRGDRMVFESGLSLPLGETFDRESFSHGVGVRGHVCVNADGEVSSATST